MDGRGRERFSGRRQCYEVYTLLYAFVTEATIAESFVRGLRGKRATSQRHREISPLARYVPSDGVVHRNY